MKDEAEVAWRDDFGEDFDKAKEDSQDLQKMMANTPDFDPTASSYYCEVTTYTSFWVSFYQLEMPEWKCNTYDGNSQTFTLTEDIPSGCDDQCYNYVNLYTQMHECNPSKCSSDEPDAMSNVYEGEYVQAPGETAYDKAYFGYFEVKFLFVLFILINCFQSLNSGSKLIVRAVNHMGMSFCYMFIMYGCTIAFQVILIQYFPSVFWFQF